VLQALDPEERAALAGLLHKLITRIEADSSITVSRQS
jgi:hypothetical protein